MKASALHHACTIGIACAGIMLVRLSVPPPIAVSTITAIPIPRLTLGMSICIWFSLSVQIDNGVRRHPERSLGRRQEHVGIDIKPEELRVPLLSDRCSARRRVLMRP